MSPAIAGARTPSELEGANAHCQTPIVQTVSTPGASAHQALRRFVERIDVLTPRPDEKEIRVDTLPDGKTCLVFRHLGNGRGDIGIRGPYTAAHYKRAPVIPLALCVVFRPGGAYPFFGGPIDLLTNRIVSLDDVWGPNARHLLDRLLTTTGSRDVARSAKCIVEGALIDRLRRLPFETAGAVAARAAVTLFDRNELTVDEVAGRVGMSSRHLRRSFHATVGVGPKTYARFVRFQHALALGRSRRTWTEVAQKTGYFDQAHLNADFRELARLSPAAAVRGSLVDIENCP
jgi:AraC-like DNA-binding protein